MIKKPEASDLRHAAIVLAGTAAIALGAQISVPMVPVPTTLQTLAVVLLGLLYGPLLALASTTLYLLSVLAGLPILSSGQQAGGSDFVQFLAAGYVVGFVAGAGLVGWLGHGRGFLRGFGAGLVGHAVILVLGAAVLGLHIGPAAAIERGVLPFLIGAVVKSLVAAALAVWAGEPGSARADHRDRSSE